MCGPGVPWRDVAELPLAEGGGLRDHAGMATINEPPLPPSRTARWLARAILGGTVVAAGLYVAASPARSSADAAAAAPVVAVSHRPAPSAAVPAPAKPRPAAHARPVAEPASELVIKRVLDTGGPIRFGNWFWDDAGVPAGPITITVDLQAEVLSIFRGGYEIGTAAVIFGADHMPTPLGVFPITQKDAHHVSNLYQAPMPYMLRLTNDGVSIHGSEVAWDAATHGCIGVPTPFAKKLFGAVKLGDRVIVTRGKFIGTGQPITA